MDIAPSQLRALPRVRGSVRCAVGIVCLVFSSAAIAPTTAAGTSWSAPVDVSSPSLFIDAPFIGFDRSGVGIAAWRWQDGVGANARAGVRAASKTLSGTFSPERAAPDSVVPPVIYGRDRVILLNEATTISRGRALGRIQLAFGRTDGRFGTLRTVDTVQSFRLPAVAANDAGRIAVAYIQVTRKLRRVVKLVVGRGMRLGRPRIISPHRGRVNAVTVAVGPRGELVVAWEREGRIEARIRRPGHRFGRVVSVGTGAKLGTRLRAAVAVTGRVWITWSSQMLSEGGGNGPFTLQTSVSSSKGSTFRRARQLDRYERRASDEARLDLALDGEGNGFVAWSGFDGRNFRARLAFASRTGRLIRSETLSQPGYDAAVGDLATSGRTGEALVVWSRLDVVGEVGTNVLAGYQPPGGRFTGEEQVSHGDRAREPAVAFNPRTGLPTAVWSQREGPDGPGVPLEQVHTFLRASTRTP